MKVLLLTDSDAFAGTEQHMLTLAVALQNQGMQVYVGCPSGSPLAVRCLDALIPTAKIEKNGGVDFTAVLDLVRFAKRYDIDIVHVHNGRTGLIARIAKYLYPCLKVVFTQHFIAPSFSKRSGILQVISNAIHSLIAGGVDHVICISAAVAHAINSRGDSYSRCSKSIVLNGIDISNVRVPSKDDIRNLRNELQMSQNTKVVLSASRLEAEKSVDMIIKAFAFICRDNPDVTLVIAGSGSQASALQVLVTELNLSSNVLFVGFRSDVNTLMAIADVFVIASEAEPFGLSILEAIVLCTPVIAADSGGPKEIIEDGYSGYLFKAGDVDSLAKTIWQCLSLECPNEVIDRAKCIVNDRFNATRMASETIRVYEHCMSPEAKV